MQFRFRDVIIKEWMILVAAAFLISAFYFYSVSSVRQPIIHDEEIALISLLVIVFAYKLSGKFNIPKFKTSWVIGIIIGILLSFTIGLTPYTIPGTTTHFEGKIAAATFDPTRWVSVFDFSTDGGVYSYSVDVSAQNVANVQLTRKMDMCVKDVRLFVAKDGIIEFGDMCKGDTKNGTIQLKDKGIKLLVLANTWQDSVASRETYEYSNLGFFNDGKPHEVYNLNTPMNFWFWYVQSGYSEVYSETLWSYPVIFAQIASWVIVALFFSVLYDKRVNVNRWF